MDGQGPGGGSRSDNLDAKIAALREKRGRYLAILRDLERSGENQISLTDPTVAPWPATLASASDTTPRSSWT